MYAWEQIQQVIDYIDEHLQDEIDIDVLAKKAALSTFYFQRLFNRLVKKPVAEYVKLRRMTKAADQLLAHHDETILSVALANGFSSHETFSRAFKTAFGLTPSQYREEKPAVNRMTKPNLMLHYTLVDEGVPLISDGIVLEINRKKLSEAIVFSGKQLDVPLSVMNELGAGTGVDPLDELWNELHAEKKSALHLPEEASELGVVFASQKEGCFCYFAGAEGECEKLPEEFSTYQLPAGEYIVCTIEAENFKTLVMDTLYKAQGYLYNTWMPKHQIMTDPFAVERYPSHSPETTSMEVWLRVVDK